MRNAAKIVAAATVFGILLSGCKTQQNSAAPQQTNPGVQAVVPNLTTPSIPKKEKTEIWLHLPEEFDDYTGMLGTEAYDLLYSNGQMCVGAISIPVQSAYTLVQYAEQDAEYYRTELTQMDGFWTLTYEDVDSNEPQTMVNVYYETDEKLWIVQGFCPSQSYPLYETEIWQYITGATFAGE